MSRTAVIRSFGKTLLGIILDSRQPRPDDDDCDRRRPMPLFHSAILVFGVARLQGPPPLPHYVLRTSQMMLPITHNARSIFACESV